MFLSRVQGLVSFQLTGAEEKTYLILDEKLDSLNGGGCGFRDGGGDTTNGKVDVETPSPAQFVSEDTTQQWSDNTSEAVGGPQ